jgi:hypothetical protein
LQACDAGSVVIHHVVHIASNLDQGSKVQLRFEPCSSRSAHCSRLIADHRWRLWLDLVLPSPRVTSGGGERICTDLALLPELILEALAWRHLILVLIPDMSLIYFYTDEEYPFFSSLHCCFYLCPIMFQPRTLGTLLGPSPSISGSRNMPYRINAASSNSGAII